MNPDAIAPLKIPDLINTHYFTEADLGQIIKVPYKSKGTVGNDLKRHILQLRDQC